MCIRAMSSSLFSPLPPPIMHQLQHETPDLFPSFVFLQKPPSLYAMRDFGTVESRTFMLKLLHDSRKRRVKEECSALTLIPAFINHDCEVSDDSLNWVKSYDPNNLDW